MNPTSINERVAQVKENDEKLNRLVEEYKPFIAACVEKATGRYVRYGEDDELSVGLMAFVEAVHSHDSSKGNFLSFAQTVIKRRLIDFYRKEKKHARVVSIHGFQGPEGDEEVDFSTYKSIETYEAEELSEYRRLEIEEIKRELQKWDISFRDLIHSSPRQEKVRRMCRDVLNFLLSRPELVALIKEKKYLPVNEIEKGLKVPRKKIERSRKYIVALVVIYTGDYQYIRDFIQIDEKGGEQH